MGGVLVCLRNGMLHEYFSEEQQIRAMTLQLNQVHPNSRPNLKLMEWIGSGLPHEYENRSCESCSLVGSHE